MGMSTSSDLLHHEHRALLYLKWLQGPERAGTVCCSNSSFVFCFFFFKEKLPMASRQLTWTRGTTFEMWKVLIQFFPHPRGWEGENTPWLHGESGKLGMVKVHSLGPERRQLSAQGKWEPHPNMHFLPKNQGWEDQGGWHVMPVPVPGQWENAAKLLTLTQQWPVCLGAQREISSRTVVLSRDSCFCNRSPRQLVWVFGSCLHWRMHFPQVVFL